ncbi:MAG: RHS repeat-associated core domain-containing protein [Oscillospiraceae bacterium]
MRQTALYPSRIILSAEKCHRATADWQCAVGTIVPKESGKTIRRIIVYCAFDHNSGTARFDNLSLRQEPVQTYSYNADGNVTAATQTGTGTEKAGYTGTDLTSYTAANGAKYTYTYNAAHDVTSASVAGIKSATTYNEAGNVTGSKLTSTEKNEQKYLESSAVATPDRNHTQRVTDVNGNTTLYDYNSLTEQLLQTKDALKRETNYTYDANSRRTTMVYRHGVAAIDYGYENGRLATLDRKTFRDKAEQHQIYSFGYNQWGQATSIGVSSPDVSTPWVLMENVYAANNGLLDSTTYGNGTVVEYTYDRLDRVTRMVYSGGRYVNYRYNAEGSLAELDYGEGDAAPTATYRFEYDSLGRLIRSQQRDGNTVTQRTEQLYDTANRLSAQGWTIGGTSYRESYAYDASDGSLTTLNTAVGTKIGYNYDALKRLRSRAVYQGSTPLFENRYAYATQSGNQSTALVEFFNYRLASDDGNGDIIVGYQYEYDNGGNITDIKAEVDGALIPLEHYEYDEKQGQLKEAIRYENGVEAERWTYSYDTAGNILSEDHEGSNSELHEYAYEDGRWGDLLTSVDGIDLEYDGSGNPTLYANGTELLWNMEWQNGRQLSRAATERDSTTEDVLDFAYDANGIRTRKTVTRNTYRPVQTYKVTFVADGKTVKTMNVTEGYTLKDSDYPAVPEKAGYTGAWQRYPSPVQSNVTVSATYTKITTYYTVTFVADGFTVKTMQVYSGYILKDSDYPSVPEKLGYEGTWQKHTTAVMGNVTVQATYRKMLPLQVQFYAEETLLKSMQVEYGYRLVDSDYPDIPEKPGYRSWWSKHSDRIIAPLDIYASYEDSMGIIDPVKPSTVDSEPTEEPWEPIEPNPNAAPEDDSDVAEQDLSQSGWTLASTETVTHEYLTQNGKVARETIRQDVSGTVLSTKTLDFFYDDSGRPFAFNYSVDGSDFETYYYILNLQGDVVQIIDANGVMQAEYVYSPWGEIISTEGDLAEINPLRYRGYYYDSETGFYYLRSRYYDPENHRFINADCIAKTEYLSISTNVFVYCLNSPVYCIDSSGTDAIWLQERDSAASMGHSGLMVQDTNEEWFFFYWGPASETFSMGLLTGTSNGCYVEKIETNGRSLSDVDDIQTVLKKAGGKAGDRAEKITDAYYFKGDYTNTYEKVMEMQADSSDYNLITRNCLQ